MATSLEGPEHDGARPHLQLPTDAGDARGIVLALHGGPTQSRTATPTWDPGYARVVLAGRAITRDSSGTLAVALLRNAVRGWNDEASPVRDAWWALDAVASRFPALPIGVLGHSLGGRTAFELVGDPRVRSLVALAPWKADAYDGAAFAGVPTLVVHGRLDPATDADASAQLVERIQAMGGRARFVSVRGSHGLLWRPGRIHRLAERHFRETLVDRGI